MTLGEKQISFMNRYFVFRKTHNVNAEKVYKLLVSREKVENTEDTELFVNDIQKQSNTFNMKHPFSFCITIA